MKRNYVLDTNVLIQDEKAMFKFKEHNVYIPQAVIYELNLLKDNYRNKDRAMSARSANKLIRNILNNENVYVNKYNGLTINTDSNGTINFIDEYSKQLMDSSALKDEMDSEIILTAVYLLENDKTNETVLVTNDNGMANRAISKFHLVVEDYKNPMFENSYTGRSEHFNIEDDIVKEIKSGRCVPLDDLNIDETHENEFLVLHSDIGDFALAKVKNNLIQPLCVDRDKDFISFVKPINVAQKFALEALSAPPSEIPLTVIQGPAGTGKTFLAVASALDMLKNNQIKQVLLLRPNVMIDNNDAALPGSEQDKVDPLMRPYWDNIKRILSRQYSEEDIEQKLKDYIDEGKIKVESFSYIRGRSIEDTYIICDESQNLLVKHAVGIMTRPGDTSKLVLIGDPSPDQIDNSYVNEYTNGLVYAMNLMKDSPLCAQMTFFESESKRSELVKDVIKRIQKRD